MKSKLQKLIIILGPTASGKTAYSIDMAKRINGAIISADSRQVYSDMNIGTAKPKEAFLNTPHTADIPDTIENIPHYLLNITTPNNPLTLSQWLASAEIALQEITKSNRIPMIVGGTMLYIDAFADGYTLPNIEPNMNLRAELEQQSPEQLYMQLQTLDPASCQFIEPHNTRRIIRALEVMSATHKKFSELRSTSPKHYDTTKIGIFPGFDTLKQNITTRATSMLAQGLEQEKAHLKNKYPNSPLLQTVNYKEHSIEEMVQSNVRYAHRQMSWWKRKKDISWICV